MSMFFRRYKKTPEFVAPFWHYGTVAWVQPKTSDMVPGDSPSVIELIVQWVTPTETGFEVVAGPKGEYLFYVNHKGETGSCLPWDEHMERQYRPQLRDIEPALSSPHRASRGAQTPTPMHSSKNAPSVRLRAATENGVPLKETPAPADAQRAGKSGSPPEGYSSWAEMYKAGSDAARESVMRQAQLYRDAQRDEDARNPVRGILSPTDQGLFRSGPPPEGYSSWSEVYRDESIAAERAAERADERADERREEAKQDEDARSQVSSRD